MMQKLRYHIAGNFRQEKIFTNFAIWSCWRKFCSMNFLSCVNDYIEHNIMATFAVLVIIYSTKYLCNTKVPGLAKIFSSKKFRLYYGTYKLLLLVVMLA